MIYEIVSKRKTRKEVIIKRPKDIFPCLKKYAGRQERFLVITLDTENKIIGIRISTIGIVNKTIVHPREVFYHAIKDNASSLMIAHNHPSGNLEPSEEDEEVTEMLVRAGEIMGFPVLDHIIFSKKDYYSFRQNGRKLKYN